jgi:hypothetical protein
MTPEAYQPPRAPLNETRSTRVANLLPFPGITLPIAYYWVPRLLRDGGPYAHIAQSLLAGLGQPYSRGLPNLVRTMAAQATYLACVPAVFTYASTDVGGFRYPWLKLRQQSESLPTKPGLRVVLYLSLSSFFSSTTINSSTYVVTANRRYKTPDQLV